jgi:hypothetical protein
MRRYGELSKDQEPLLPLQFCADCITATRGYDFREGQPRNSTAQTARVIGMSTRFSAASASIAGGGADGLLSAQLWK